MLVLFRFGSFIPVPGISVDALKSLVGGDTRTIFDMFNLFSGGNFARASIFAMGIMPYITSSIVMQLLGSIIPFFEKLKKEGAEGQKKLNQYTRYGTVLVGIFNAIGMAVIIMSQEGVVNPEMSRGLFMFTTIISMVTGTMIVLWLGEQITEKGIGNGISLIIFGGIIAEYPGQFIRMFTMIKDGAISIPNGAGVLLSMVVVTAAVILITEATRRLNVQYPKRVVGRKVFGGQSTYIPLKVNAAGVIPIIFGQSVIMIPSTIASFFPNTGFGNFMTDFFAPGKALYMALFMLLIVFFSYFYTAIIMNPVDMADNMKKHGGFIPGIQPGKHTAAYINNVLTRITLPGAIFFAFIAVVPDLMTIWVGNIPIYFGGTGIIIIVGVALETLRQIESHLVMRHYDGFMKKGKLRGRQS